VATRPLQRCLLRSLMVEDMLAGKSGADNEDLDRFRLLAAEAEAKIARAVAELEMFKERQLAATQQPAGQQIASEQPVIAAQSQLSAAAVEDLQKGANQSLLACGPQRSMLTP